MRQELKVGRAWAIKEALRCLWSYVYPASGWKFWKRWYFWATHSRLEPIRKAAETVRRHIENILTYYQHPVTNAMSEGLNSQIQKIKSMPAASATSSTSRRRSTSTAEDLISTHAKPRSTKIIFANRTKIVVRTAYVSLGVKIRDSAFGHLKSLKRTQSGFILVDSLQRTSIAGAYAVGDCVNDLFQVSVAAWHAAIAATDVHNSLPF